MFSIADGRDRLYQWDRNVKVRLDDPENEIGEVTVKSRYSRECYSVEIVRTETEAYIMIPNILLQKSYDIILYAFCYVDECTKNVTTIEVLARPKPPDYVYTEGEVLAYNLFEERLSRLERNGGSVNGVPPGGKAGQFLRKNSDADFDISWSDFEIPEQYGLVTYDQNKTITIT